MSTPLERLELLRQRIARGNGSECDPDRLEFLDYSETPAGLHIRLHAPVDSGLTHSDIYHILTRPEIAARLVSLTFTCPADRPQPRLWNLAELFESNRPFPALRALRVMPATPGDSSAIGLAQPHDETCLTLWSLCPALVQLVLPAALPTAILSEDSRPITSLGVFNDASGAEFLSALSKSTSLPDLRRLEWSPAELGAARSAGLSVELFQNLLASPALRGVTQCVFWNPRLPQAAIESLRLVAPHIEIVVNKSSRRVYVSRVPLPEE